MRLIPATTPRPRLLSSAAPDFPSPASGAGETAPARGGGFRRLIVLLGAAALVAAGLVFGRSYLVPSKPVITSNLVQATTHSLTASPTSAATPAPITVQINADMLRVTAISLGNPRLALINGKQVAEGDVIVLHTPTRSVAVSLQVLKISDGRIDLSDGSQVFMARLIVPSPDRR